MRQRKFFVATSVALLLIFAGCKGESPTSPSTTPITTTTPSTPPSGASVVLTVSNANPLVNSTSVITATVTQNGQPVVNGTAVQFTTTGGSFTDTGASGSSVIKTTTNGVATATLTSGSAGAVTVTATVNNVSKTATVTFGSSPIEPPPPSTAPTISTITPTTGRPEGGEVLTITGTHFRAPVRVVFTCEGSATTPPDPAACNGQTTKDALVTSVTDTQIKAITPSFNVAAGQAVTFGVTVFVGAGTSSELSVAQSGAFTFTSPTLTPKVRALSPTSGPIGGGTRVTIFGDGFQAPTQVLFGSAEAQVVSVNFNQIIVMSPRASDTAPTGSGTVVGAVDVLVRNVNSGTETTSASAFRYIPKMVITTAGPTQGPITGGTRVTIDGSGFDDPLGVSIGGVAALVIKVTGSQVVAITAAPLVTSCANVSGPIVITNTENGDSATGPDFTYIVPLPKVVSALGPVTAGGTTTVTVLNASGIPRISIGGVPATITGSTDNGDGTTTYTVIVPTTLKLGTTECMAVSGASAQDATPFDIVYTSLTTGCTDTFANGLTVTPSGPILTNVPAGFAPFTATAASGTTPATPAPDQTITFTNTGGGTITVNSVTGCSAAPFTTSVPPTPATLGPCDPFPISVHYATQASGSSATCSITVTTSAGTRTINVSGSTQ